MNAKELERWLYNRVQYKRDVLDSMNTLLLYADTFGDYETDDYIKDLSNRITMSDYVQVKGNDFEKIVEIFGVVPEMEADEQFIHYQLTTPQAGVTVCTVLVKSELDNFKFSKSLKEETL